MAAPPHSHCFGRGTLTCSSTCSGIGRLTCFPYSAPLLRPGHFGFFFRFPLENGAACRFSRRNDSSSSLRSRSFSATSFSFCFRRESISLARSSTVGAWPESSGFIHAYGNPTRWFCSALFQTPSHRGDPRPGKQINYKLLVTSINRNLPV